MSQPGSQKKEWATPQVRSIELRDALTALLERGGAGNAATLSSNHRPLRVANR
jgi:hypothetical protein